MLGLSFWKCVCVRDMQFGAAEEECELREKEGALGHGVQTSQAVEVRS